MTKAGQQVDDGLGKICGLRWGDVDVDVAENEADDLWWNRWTERRKGVCEYI